MSIAIDMLSFIVAVFTIWGLIPPPYVDANQLDAKYMEAIAVTKDIVPRVIKAASPILDVAKRDNVIALRQCQSTLRRR